MEKKKVEPYYMIAYIPNYIGGTAAIGYRQYNKEFWLDDGDVYTEEELRAEYPQTIFLSDFDVHSMFDAVKELLGANK